MQDDKIPQGYKDSPLGIIPEKWVVKRLENIADIDKQSLSSNTPEDYEFNYISLSDVDSDDFKVEMTKQVFRTAPSRARRIVSKGDILMSTVRPNLQGFTIIREDVKNLIASTGFSVISSTKCCNEYLFQLIFSESVSRQFHQLLVGTNYPAINSNDVKRMKILFPPLPEQQGIAEILTCWDKAIEKQSQLIDRLEIRKRGLMQQLLTGKKRIKGFDEKWENAKLGEVGTFISGIGFSENEQGGAKGVPFYKVSDMNLYGNEFKMNFANNYVSDEQIKRCRYKVIHSGAVIFAKVGAAIFLERKRLASSFLIDNNMMAFIPHSNNLLYIKYLFDIIVLSKYIQVGALPSYNAADLNTIKIKLPPLEEQTAITNILSTADSEIQTEKEKLTVLKSQKKGLIQQLLTGKKRVKI